MSGLWALSPPRPATLFHRDWSWNICKKGSCQFLVNECTHVLVNRLEDWISHHHHHHHHHQIFIDVQVQGQHPHQWAPFLVAGLLHIWQISHQISRYVYHESQVAHWIWWWQYLTAWHCRSVWSLPCHFDADVGGLALSMAKSHWNGALRSAHKSYTHGHVSWKSGVWKRELVAAPWTSSRRFSHVLWLKVHSHQLMRACLLGSKRKLIPPNCHVPTWTALYVWSAIQGACSYLAPCTSVIRVFCQALEHTAFLVHTVLAAVAENAVAAHSSATDGPWKLAWTLQEVQTHTTDHDLHLSCIYSQSFLLHCFFPSQQPPDTFLEQFSDDNKVIGIEVLPGDPEQNLRDKASSTMMKSSGLTTEPWRTPTFTSNSSLYPSPTRTRLRALAYIPCTSRTIHSSIPSFLSAHQMTLRGTPSNAFFRSTKAM